LTPNFAIRCWIPAVQNKENYRTSAEELAVGSITGKQSISTKTPQR